MSAPSTLADCCPECWPGDNPASLPLVVIGEPDHPGSLWASYRCTRGHEWACWWDAQAAEWPTPRRAA
jgi:hypothetical protein